MCHNFIKILELLSNICSKDLKKNPIPWTKEHTRIIKQVKTRVKELSCLGILHLDAFPIIKTDVSYIGYDGILKQYLQNKISIVCFHSGIWNN